MIEGETGTGKEALAEAIHELSEAIHELSPRADAPFVVFDCTTTPAQLMESDLFGHERGAFTGAVAPRKGVFELARGGTLLIDEIGELDLALQPKLLRPSSARRSGGSARKPRSASTCGSSRRPGAISTRRFPRDHPDPWTSRATTRDRWGPRRPSRGTTIAKGPGGSAIPRTHRGSAAWT